jgi:hypothetical protein
LEYPVLGSSCYRVRRCVPGHSIPEQIRQGMVFGTRDLEFGIRRSGVVRDSQPVGRKILTWEGTSDNGCYRQSSANRGIITFVKKAKTNYFAERFWLRQHGCYHPTEGSLRRMHRRDMFYFWTLGPSLVLFLIGWFGHRWLLSILAIALCLVVLIWRSSSTLHIEQKDDPPRPNC